MNASSLPPQQRRSVGPVRQHSLQQPIIRRPQQQIRRQRSTDDERSLQQHSRVRFSPGLSAKNDHNHNHHHNVPKVRVAWNDPVIKTKNDNSVEIVARQIPTGKTVNRPTTGRACRGPAGRCSIGEKATILYSRQELAERLRLAWKQREENKCNIDIFLAHNTVEERCDSSHSTATATTSSAVGPIVASSTPNPRRGEGTEGIESTAINVKSREASREFPKPSGCHFQAWLPTIETKKLPLARSDDHRPRAVAQAEDREEIKEDKSNITASEDEEENEKVDEDEEDAPREKKSFISINCCDWNTSVTISDKAKTSVPSVPTKEPDFSRAKLKRASFQSGLNKAFNTPVVDKSPTPRISSRASSTNSNCIGSVQDQETARFRRTNSAPPQRRDNQANATGAANSNNVDDCGTASNDQSRFAALKCAAVATARPVKSATLTKRRSKLSKRRASSVGGSKDDVTEDGKGGKARGTKGGSTVEPKCADVVTMVSLVSSADSESEMDENSLRDDKLISELRNKLPTTPIIKSSSGLSGGFRKPFKSVSFQKDSFDSQDSPRSASANSREDESRSSLRARFNALSKSSSVAGVEDTPLLTAATLTLSSWRSESSPSLLAQPQAPRRFAETSSLGITETIVLTDREKRCLAVPIGDVHDKKRKLVRCRSAVSGTPRISDVEKQSPSLALPSDGSQACLRTDLRLSQIDSRTTNKAMQENVAPKTSANPMMASEEAPPEKSKDLPREPYGQTPKEKECWHLYRRMCDKGVFVSFDTVLRGMLTPTEYRLRQKEVSQNC